MFCRLFECFGIKWFGCIVFWRYQLAGLFIFISSSYVFPTYISVVHHTGWDFSICDCFFNPAIEVVTFHPPGWFMLGMFLLPAFTQLGHEWWGSFESVRWNGCVHRLDLNLYFHPKEFSGNGVRTHVNSKGKIPSTGGSGGSNHFQDLCYLTLFLHQPDFSFVPLSVSCI